MARDSRYGRLLAAALAGCLFAVVGCGENPVPERPTYSRDVKPLVEARCIRCHGAGGTLNQDPDIPDASAWKGAPTNGDFTSLADDAAGKHGLAYYTTTGGFILFKGFLQTMPPPPADPLSERDMTILLRWAQNPLP
jgi:hypothetical protein